MSKEIEEKVFEHIKQNLDKQKTDLEYYINNYFTQEESIRHSDNLHNFF